MISIIITAYKEERTIGKAIQAVLDNKLQENFEILVLAPDEGTLKIAKDFSKKNKEVKVFKDPGKGKPAALNLAFSKVRGEILVLTDGDVYMGENAISELLKGFTDGGVGAVASRPISLNSKKKMLELNLLSFHACA